MLVDHIRLPALARSLKKAATVLVLGTLILAYGASQVAAAASNGVLTTAFVTDDLCVAGPYKNSSTAPLSVSFGANTAGDWESIFLFFWRESDQWGYSQRTVAPPAGSTWASSAGDFSVNENALLGTSVYYYLYGYFGDAGIPMGIYVLAERRGEKRLEDALEWLIAACREALPPPQD